MAEAVNFGLSNIFDDSKRTSQNSLINQGQIDYNRQKAVSSSYSSYLGAVAKYNYGASFIGRGMEWANQVSEGAIDQLSNNELLSTETLQKKYGSDVVFNRPMGAIQAAGYVSRQKRLNELERLTHTYMGNSFVGAVGGVGATIAGSSGDIIASTVLANALVVPMIAGLGGVAARSAGVLGRVGSIVSKPYVADVLANTVESLAFDPLYGKLATETGLIQKDQYGAFVRNNMLLNIGLGTLASVGADFAFKGKVGSKVSTRAMGVESPSSVGFKEIRPSVLVEDGKLNLSAINTRVKEAYGGGDIPTDHLEMELDARSRGFLGDVPFEDSPLGALIPSSKTLDDVLSGKGDDLFKEIDLQARRVNDLAEAPNGFKVALRDLIDEGATPNEVVRTLEAYDLIGGDTPTRFQEMLDEGLTLEEKGLVDATMQAYFEKKARYKEGVHAEATLDASDQFRIASKPLEEPSIAPSNPAKISPLTVAEDSERVLRDYVERADYDKPAEERQKIADAMLASAKTMAIRDLDDTKVMEDLLGLSLEDVSTPDPKAVAQLFNQPEDVIQAAINCLAKEN